MLRGEIKDLHQKSKEAEENQLKLSASHQIAPNNDNALTSKDQHAKVLNDKFLVQISTAHIF